MLDIYICEDSDAIRESIGDFINRHLSLKEYDMKVELVTSKPNVVINHIKEKRNQGIYFLDIELGAEINGIELAREIRKVDTRGYIVFVTTHNEMMKKTFEYKVQALDFIEKDDETKMFKAISLCLKSIVKNEKLLLEDEEKKFWFKSGEKEYIIDYNQILYFETSDKPHVIKIYTINRQVEFYGKLSDIENRLDKRFCRCHKSVLVNTALIKEFTKTKREILMINGDICKVSARGSRLLKSVIKEEKCYV